MLNYALLGNDDEPFAYHALNLAVHVVNVLLAWLLVAEVTERDDAAFAAAAVSAVLPVSVEAVTNIVGRADLLAQLGRFTEPERVESTARTLTTCRP